MVVLPDRPVGAEKPEDVAARHLQRELVDGEDFAVPLGERPGFYYEVVGCHGRHPNLRKRAMGQLSEAAT